jgi:hypothetical protein
MDITLPTAFPKNTANLLLEVNRLPQHAEFHYEIKDPSIVQVNDNRFMMFASVGNSVTQTWLVGRFEAESPEGPWTELEPVKFVDLSGPQLCAPAVTLIEEKGIQRWFMYIQTACFEEGGVIALATSDDGETFYGQPQALISRESIDNAPTDVIGVYDVGYSELKHGDQDVECMVYSGYRRVGCGDIYMSTRTKGSGEWGPGQCILSQENVPFHNSPDYEYFEWGLEGAKIIQLADDCFVMIGVCFLPMSNEHLGKRQRVFFAVTDSLDTPFTPVNTPFEPTGFEGKFGENGHPDTLTINDTLHVIYQERHGNGEPWHLRAARYSLSELASYFRLVLGHKSTNAVEAGLMRNTL